MPYILTASLIKIASLLGNGSQEAGNGKGNIEINKRKYSLEQKLSGKK